jgi:hypothetical protein
MNVRRIAGDGQNPAERATYGANISTGESAASRVAAGAAASGGHLPALCCALHLNAALIHGFDLHCPARPLCARSEERPPRSIPCFCGDGDRSRAELSGRGVRAGRPD